MRKHFKRLRLSPSLNILLGFLGIILVGTLLLSLPISNANGVWLNVVDSLFTSTSAVCVTGLVVVDVATQFTLFGEIVILILIQIGGLGIIAITSLVFMILRKKIKFSSRVTIQESLNKETIQGVVKFIKKSILVCFLIEFVGVLLLLYSTISFTGQFWKGLYYAIFLSISAFCNAGFDVLENETQFTSLYAFAGNVTMLLPLMLLIVLGGIGFVVLFDIFKKSKHSQHVNIVVIMTLVLVFGGALLFTIMEWNNPNTLGGLGVFDKIVNGFFQSVTARTAGFASIDQNLITSGSRILTMIFMFIGGAPNSTAGGIKITTLFILLLFMFRLPNENGDIRLYDRKVSKKIIMKAFRIIAYTILTLVVAVVLIDIFEYNSISFESIVFECVSAISTVGLSMGITVLLSVPSKLVLIALMFVGRVGLITVVLAISNKGNNSNKQEIEYSNTDIMIG